MNRSGFLRYISSDAIRQHPKIMMGSSDTTVTLSAFLRAGVAGFYGPVVLCDLAENCGIRPFVERSMRRALFEAEPFELEAADTWTEEFLTWDQPANQSRPRHFARGEGWVWLQGESSVTGRLVGGCLDVLEFLKGTPWWIPNELWDGAIFFVETSEEAPPPNRVGYWLRNYGSQGILDRICGMLFARPMKYSPQMTQALYAEVRRILVEFGCEDMPVVANMDLATPVRRWSCRLVVAPSSNQ